MPSNRATLELVEPDRLPASSVLDPLRLIH